MVLSLTGSLLVFKDDYLRLTMPAAQQAADLSPAALANITAKAEVSFETSELRALVYATPDLGLHKVYLTEGRAAYLNFEGDVIDIWDANGRFEDWLFDLHHRLLAGQTGLWIAGLSGLAAAGLVVGGLIAFWPARRGLKRGLKIKTTSRVQLLSLHRNLGVYAALPILVLGLTGAALSFPATSRALFDHFGGAQTSPKFDVQPGKVDWLRVLHQVETHYPNAAPRIVIWPRSDGPAQLRLKTQEEWHPNGRTLVTINPANSEILNTQDANQEGTGRRAFNALYPIHAAHIGGRLYDLVVFLIGLAFFGLGLIGAVSFWVRFKPK